MANQETSKPSTTGTGQGTKPAAPAPSTSKPSAPPMQTLVKGTDNGVIKNR